jgi:DNA-binding response OmpR family regulator
VAKVLVVEDDPTILDAVAFNLEREGYEVLTAADGVTGLERAREDQPDLVVLDIMLPRMSGLDVLRLLREEQPVPILMLTARDAEADRVQGLEFGADDYVSKPFSMRELRARVAALLRRDQISREAGVETATGANEVRIGEFTHHVSGQEILLRGEAITLRPREYELLAFMIEHPNQVLSRELILERVWGYAYAGETRTVDVHVRWLREKIEADPSAPEHIQTVRGTGYKFVP